MENAAVNTPVSRARKTRREGTIAFFCEIQNARACARLWENSQERTREGDRRRREREGESEFSAAIEGDILSLRIFSMKREPTAAHVYRVSCQLVN